MQNIEIDFNIPVKKCIYEAYALIWPGITKWLNQYRSTFLYENGIQYDYQRKYNGRKIILARCGGEHDSHDRYDGSFGMPPHADMADTGNADNLLSEAESGG